MKKKSIKIEFYSVLREFKERTTNYENVSNKIKQKIYNS